MPIANGCYYNLSQLGKASDLPLILIHGAGGSHLGWHTQLRRMPDRTVYALDLPGHGKSMGEGRHSVAEYASDILSFMESVGIYRAVLAGHSLGGMIALQAGMVNPERIGGLVLVSTSASCPVPADIVQGLLHPVTYKQSLDWLVDRLSGSSGDRKWVEATRQAVAQTRRGVLYGDLLACRSFDIGDRLAGLSMPTCVISGGQDKFFPTPMSRRLARSIPGALWECIPGAGHLLSLEKPDELDQIVRPFLNGIK